MINLLPPNEKQELRAARSNTLLVRYNIFLVAGIAFMILAAGVVYVYLNTTKANAETLISENELQTSEYVDVERRANEFRANLQIAKQIFDRKVNYSDTALKLASLMPSGTILETLTLDSATFGSPTTINAKAINYERALALKNSFEKSDLFTDVNFQNIAGSDEDGYPITANINVTFKKQGATQ